MCIRDRASLVSQRVEEGQQIGPLLLVQFERVDEHIDLREAVGAAAAVAVEVNHLFQRAHGAVVHVGCRQGDVAQRRHLERAEHAVGHHARPAGIVAIDPDNAEGVGGERRRAVTLEAARRPAAEDGQAAALLGRKGVEVAGGVAVERAVVADERALEGGQGAGNGFGGDGVGAQAVGALEQGDVCLLYTSRCV